MLDLIRTQQLDIMLSLGSMTAIIAFFIAMTGMNTRKKKALFLMEASATFLLLSARFCWIYNDHPGTFASWMSRINNFLDYFGIVAVLFAFNMYLKEMFAEAEGVSTDLIRFKIIDILMAIDAVCICLSPFTGLCYSLDENNNYSRGPAVAVCFTVPLIAMMIQISLILQHYRKLSKNMRLSVLLFSIMPFPGAVLQFLFYGLETTNITIVCMAVLLYIFDLADINKTADMSLRAIAANEAKSAFLSNMSHEIRTPINAVLGMNEMILRESDDPEILSYSENIKTAGNTLLGLINDILDLSKIEAGKIEIIPVDYDLSELIGSLVNMISVRTEAKGLELKLDIDKTMPKMLNGDEVRIKQVITNILTNAVKYTEKGSVTLKINGEGLLHDPDRVVLKVTVSDTGIGIKEEDMKKLFSKFERIEEKRNRNIEGTGLGMNITKNLLEMMGSELHVESIYGRGSTFSFLLEQNVAAWDELGDFRQSQKEELKKHKKYKERLFAPDAKILVVDDYDMNLAVFKSLLKQTKIRVDTADSGIEGLKKTLETKYDLLFFDHMMPGKDGIETLKELKEMSGNPNISVPVICLTANAISGAREQYISAGFNDYLTKPVDPVKLEEMLIEYLPKEKISADESEEKTEEENELLPLMDQDIINIDEGIYFSGSKEMYIKILKKFYDSIDDRLGAIDGLYSDRNYSDYTIKVHALKSSLKMIGAKGLGEEAQALEDAGKNGDPEYIEMHHDEFRGKVLNLKEILKNTAVKGDKGQGEFPEADEIIMAGVFEEIRHAAEDMDSNRLDSIFDEMKIYRIPEENRELYNRLKEAAHEFDYEAILKELGANGHHRKEK